MYKKEMKWSAFCENEWSLDIEAQSEELAIRAAQSLDPDVTRVVEIVLSDSADEAP